jgi:hypothetical protein
MHDMTDPKTRWRGWMSVHRGINGVHGVQLAVSPAYEYEVPGDASCFDAAQDELDRRWRLDGMPVTAQWADSDNALAYPNVDPIS